MNSSGLVMSTGAGEAPGKMVQWMQEQCLCLETVAPKHKGRPLYALALQAQGAEVHRLWLRRGEGVAEEQANALS